MPGDVKNAWFAPKRYGYGASPSTWQGWLATIVFVIIVMIDTRFFHGLAGVISVAILLAVFVTIVYAKTSGEWRWGER
jgi:hypothetical protein